MDYFINFGYSMFNHNDVIMFLYKIKIIPAAVSDHSRGDVSYKKHDYRNYTEPVP